MGKFHDDGNEVYPTARQEKAAIQSDYRRELIEPWEIIGLMLSEMIDAANQRGLDPKPIHDLANHAEEVQMEIGGRDE